MKGKSVSGIFNDYDAFVDKFKPNKTTDDCYTPPAVYEVVKQWVNDNIISLDDVPIVRPFYPGGDYENYDYPEGCIVLDNPPFSILAKIRRFYHARGIKYFLFAPTLTIANSAKELPCTYVISGDSIIYENGAKVNTSFITNLDCGDTLIWCAGDLSKKIKESNVLPAKQALRYTYPLNVVSPAIIQKLSRRGLTFKVKRDSAFPITRIDSQLPFGKALFGGAG